MSAADLRNELRELRKEHIKPVSKMPKKDVAAEIQRLKVAREETPAVAATKAAPKAVSKKEVEPLAGHQDSTFEKVSSGTKKGMERKTARKAYEDLPAEKKGAKAAPKKAAPKEEKAAAPAPKKGRPAKGSKEAAEHMARIRAMRGKKKEE